MKAGGAVNQNSRALSGQSFFFFLEGEVHTWGGLDYAALRYLYPMYQRMLQKIVINAAER